jgi:hypothetical protein
MPESLSSRPVSTTTTTAASSLMQDVPGAFPAPTTPSYAPSDAGDNTYNGDDGADLEVTFQSLSQAVHARRAEYVRPKEVRIKVGTWNVAAFKGTEKDVGDWFVGGKGTADALTGSNLGQREVEPEDVADQEARCQRNTNTLPKSDVPTLPHGQDVGLYVLNLQEVVDITAVSEALRPYTDPAAATKWKDAMAAALPDGYQLIAEQQLLGLLLLIYAAPDVEKEIKAISTTSVGTGVFGYMGNKGAVTARLVLGDTTRLVFINCHLAAGADKASLERRNWDAQQIISRTKFEPIRDALDLTQTSGEGIGDEDFAFWSGDLNYRLEGIPGDDVRRLLMLHTRNQYDLSQPSAKKIEDEVREATASLDERLSLEDTGSARMSSDGSRHDTLIDELRPEEDPASLQTTLASLLPHDELRQQIAQRKAFADGWQEGPITFLPTYKYDPGSMGVFDSSEKKRAPSWCDRILYRRRKEKLAYDAKIREEENARKKDEHMKTSGIDQAATDEEVLYDYDPENDGADAGESEGYDEYDETAEENDDTVVTKEGFEDEITLEYYTSHQRVLSSDHKPLDACFMLKYEAVVPELKAHIHAEVAWELDKAENEGRPNVTVVIDKQTHTSPAENNDQLPGGHSDEGVSFGEVRWGQSKHRSLTVANTSRVPATFSFIERPVDSNKDAGITPKWLALKINDTLAPSASPRSDPFTLEPGDAAVVDLDLRITSLADVRNFNESHDSEIEDILVLRVEHGRDHFIPVRGTWLPSSLARTIDTLVRIPEGGIRKLQGQKPDDGSGKSKVKKAADTVSAAQAFGADLSRVGSAGSVGKSESERPYQLPPVRFSAPRELFRLTEAIEELMIRVVAEWEMMNEAPIPSVPTSPSSSASVTPSARQSSESIQSVHSIGRFSILPAPAPWDLHPGWPFDEACWKDIDLTTTSPSRGVEEGEGETNGQEPEITDWNSLLSLACDALDTDLCPLSAALPASLPRATQLYCFSNLLLLFLQSMPDGIIPAALWNAKISPFMLREASKSKPPPLHDTDEFRSAVQELLAEGEQEIFGGGKVGHAHHYSISFVLLVGMLERCVQEVLGSSSSSSMMMPMPELGVGSSTTAGDASSSTTPSSHSSPSAKRPGIGSGLKRMATFGAGRKSTSSSIVASAPAVCEPVTREVREARVARAYAEIFARVLVRSQSGGVTVGREDVKVERRKVEFMERFLMVGRG